ncbi:MAG: DUF58 domain-containing protein [bacterium]
MMLIEPEFMKKLERLRISSRKLFSGAIKGKRRSIKRGSSVEFADYRDYQPGDDFRFIDWNIYSRLDRLFLKTFVEEENIYIHILLDVSASMNFGNPSKLEYAKKIATALGYIGLIYLDTVAVSTFAEELNELRYLRGKDRIFILMKFLENIESSNAKSLMDSCLKRYAGKSKHAGVAIIISDFLVPKITYEEGLKSLIYKNFDINLIHIMDYEEINPTLSGELRLRDSETGEIKEVTITDRLLDQYRVRLEKFRHDLENFCERNNILYVFTDTKTSLDDLMLKTLRREKVLL